MRDSRCTVQQQLLMPGPAAPHEEEAARDADIDAWDLASRLNIERNEVVSFRKHLLHVEMENVKSHFSVYMEEKNKGERKPAFFRKK